MLTWDNTIYILDINFPSKARKEHYISWDWWWSYTGAMSLSDDTRKINCPINVTGHLPQRLSSSMIEWCGLSYSYLHSSCQLLPQQNEQYFLASKGNLKYRFFKSFFYCCSSTVVSISPYHSLPPQPSPPPTLDPTPLWLCPCVPYTCSSTTFPPFPNKFFNILLKMKE